MTRLHNALIYFGGVCIIAAALVVGPLLSHPRFVRSDYRPLPLTHRPTEFQSGKMRGEWWPGDFTA